MRKALSAIRHWPKPPCCQVYEWFFYLSDSNFIILCFLSPPKKTLFCFQVLLARLKNQPKSLLAKVSESTLLSSESSRKQSRSLHSARHISQQAELLLIKICALAAHAAVREVGKANGNPIHSGWVKKAAESTISLRRYGLCKQPSL